MLANSKHMVDKVVLASRSIYGEGKYKHPILGEVYPSHRKESEMLSGDFEIKYEDNEVLELLATCEDSKYSLHPFTVLLSKTKSK
jgi:dTDP-L-rhamnose 4-epimerase